MTYLKLVVLLLQVTQSILRWMDKQSMIAEGERRVIAKQLAALAATAKVVTDIRTDIGNKTDDEVDAALRGDYRP